VAERLYTTLITCSLDGQAHNVTDESVAAGREAGRYEALCGYVVVPAPMVAPAGRPCPDCTAVLTPQQPDPATASGRRPRHRKRGWLWRMLHPHGHSVVGAVTHRPT
jgi:hypothetical protein